MLRTSATMCSTVTVVLLLLLSPIRSVFTSLAPTQLLVTRVGPCDGVRTNAVRISEFSITTRTYDTSLTGILNVTEDLENGWKVRAEMQKCVDIRNMDTCDFFKSYQLVRNGCSDDEDDAEIYGMLFHYSKPAIECPIQAGQYKIQDYPFFMEDNYLTVYESRISTSVFGYVFKMEGFTDDDKKIFCVEAYLQLLYIRDHDWFKRTNLTTTVTPKNLLVEDEYDNEE